MAFAFDVVDTVREEEPDLFDDELGEQIRQMLDGGASTPRRSSPRTSSARAWPGCRPRTCAATSSTSPTSGMQRLGLPAIYGSKNPFAFMELQDVQELSNFFERKVSAYQVGVSGEVGFDEEF